MFLTLISIATLFGLFIGLAVMALRHGVDSRTDTRGSLVSADHSGSTRGFWR